MASNEGYLIQSDRAAELPPPPPTPVVRRRLARCLLGNTGATLLAVAIRYYDGDVQAAKADIYDVKGA